MAKHSPTTRDDEKAFHEIGQQIVNLLETRAESKESATVEASKRWQKIIQSKLPARKTIRPV